MYINWAHYYIPKFNGICSFFINPMFIFIIMTDKKLSLGNYKYLLLYFSIFNMSCSLCDILVPMVAFDYHYAFSAFISDGIFVKYSEVNQIILAIRCSFITGTYAILHSHFVYRLMVLSNSNFLQKYFLPYGLVLSVFYLVFHMLYFIVACYYYLGADRERRLYLREAINETYELDTFEINIIIAVYQDLSYDSVHKSIIGIIMMNFLSVDSVLLYFILGFLTIKKLNSYGIKMSKRTKKLQRQLMKALVVQSVIPTVVSFSPCIICWYQPIFGVNIGRWTQDFSVIALSAFPLLDPLAIILFITTFRFRFIKIFRGFIQLLYRPTPTEDQENKEQVTTRT